MNTYLNEASGADAQARQRLDRRLPESRANQWLLEIDKALFARGQAAASGAGPVPVAAAVPEPAAPLLWQAAPARDDGARAHAAALRAAAPAADQRGEPTDIPVRDAGGDA